MSASTTQLTTRIGSRRLLPNTRREALRETLGGRRGGTCFFAMAGTDPTLGPTARPWHTNTAGNEVRHDLNVVILMLVQLLNRVLYWW